MSSRSKKTPSKHVHFSSVSTTIPPGWPTAKTISSFNPSPLYKPPPLPSTHRHGRHNSHYEREHSPSPSYDSQPLVHTILSAASSSHNLHWDVSSSPSTAYSHYHSMSKSFPSPATKPPTTSMRIHCRHIPWEIILHGSSPDGHVTVYDMLEGLFLALNKPVAEERYFKALRREDQRRLVRAYEERCQRAKDLTSVMREKGMGLRVVDYLMGRTRFAGLTTSSTRPGMWTLHIQ